MLQFKAGQDRELFLFQTAFHTPPQVLYALSCFSFQLARKTSPPPRRYGHGHGYGHGYGGYRPRRGPQKLGVVVQAVGVTSRGVTFHRQDLSFGGQVNAGTCVSFLACSFGPGKEIAPPGPPDTTPYEPDWE